MLSPVLRLTKSTCVHVRWRGTGWLAAVMALWATEGLRPSQDMMLVSAAARLRMRTWTDKGLQNQHVHVGVGVESVWVAGGVTVLMDTNVSLDKQTCIRTCVLPVHSD